MTNRDFDDDFNFDDDFGSDSSDDLSDDLSPDFGDENDSGDLPDLGDEPEERGSEGGGGPSRSFIMIAVIMIVLFLVGLGALLFFATRDQGPTDLEYTATSIVMTNIAVGEQLTATNFAIVAFNETATAQANFTDTPTPRPTITPTFTPTEAPTLDPTELAALAFTQTAEANALATQTAIAELSAIPPTQEGIGLEAVQQTATALALAFGATPTAGELGTGGGVASPTPEGSGGTTGQLPQTGFFDEVVGGGRNGVGLIVLMGFGLVGVIFISRRLRAVNDK